MFKRRFLFAALLFALACLPVPPSAFAVSDEQKTTTASRRKSTAKASPSPKPKASASPSKTTSKPSPAKTSSTKPKPASSPAPAKAASSASTEASPKKAPTSQSSKKKPKKKAKPRPATKKRTSRPAAQQDEEPKRTEPELEKRQEPEKKTEPVQKSTPEPSPISPKTGITAPQGRAVVVQKSGIVEEEPAPTPEPEEKARWWWPFGRVQRYKYLTASVREAIDDARVPRHRWRYIVVHNSGTRQGNAKAFDYYHRNVRKMPNGMAYHFVIGNGTSSGNGRVEIGQRWRRQINGGHVHSDYLNSIALGICLVGDYNRDKPTPEQLEALAELVRYLRQRVGKTDHQLAIVKPHCDINPPQWPTDCPGNRFPYEWLHSKFD